MPPRPDLTALHLRVLAFLLQHPRTQGSDVSAAVGVKSGTLYPLLRQLAERGLLLAEVQAFGSGRTTYTVSGLGQRAFREAATALIADLSPALALASADPSPISRMDIWPEPAEGKTTV